MPEREKPEYEDSYQKRERLERELDANMATMRNSLDAFSGDLKKFDGLSEKFDAIEVELQELDQEKQDLEAQMQKQQAELARIKATVTEPNARIKSLMDLLSEIDETWGKILKVDIKANSLAQKQISIVVDGPAQLGDAQGVLSVAIRCMKDAQEIMGQLTELDRQEEL